MPMVFLWFLATSHLICEEKGHSVEGTTLILLIDLIGTHVKLAAHRGIFDGKFSDKK
jgi:hypothetical protein